MDKPQSVPQRYVGRRIVAIIQARMSSSRLPGKVLRDIGGQPMLARVVERTRLAQTLDEVIVATTSDPSDDPIAIFCAQRNYPFYRGSLHDVLDRYYQGAQAFSAQVIVRITADCPLIDPAVIDQTVRAFLGQAGSDTSCSVISSPESRMGPDEDFPWDFAANRLPPPWGRTYPIGLDTEICTFQALEQAWKEADQPYQREHVMPYLYDHGAFRAILLNTEPDFGRLRWTVDTAEDLELVRQIFAHFAPRWDFSWLEVVELFKRQPSLARINQQVQHKDFRDVDSRR